MRFEDKIKKINGMLCLYQGSKCRVLQAYQNDKALIQIVKGAEYSFQIDAINMSFVSNGHDKIVTSIKDLSPIAR